MSSYVYVIIEKDEENFPARKCFKLGETANVEQRLTDLGGGNPSDFEVFHLEAFESKSDAQKVEQLALDILKEKGFKSRGSVLKSKRKHEWIMATSDEAVEAITEAKNLLYNPPSSISDTLFSW